MEKEIGRNIETIRLLKNNSQNETQHWKTRGRKRHMRERKGRKVYYCTGNRTVNNHGPLVFLDKNYPDVAVGRPVECCGGQVQPSDQGERKPGKGGRTQLLKRPP